MSHDAGTIVTISHDAGTIVTMSHDAGPCNPALIQPLTHVTCEGPIVTMSHVTCTGNIITMSPYSGLLIPALIQTIYNLT